MKKFNHKNFTSELRELLNKYEVHAMEQYFTICDNNSNRNYIINLFKNYNPKTYPHKKVHLVVKDLSFNDSVFTLDQYKKCPGQDINGEFDPDKHHPANRETESFFRKTLKARKQGRKAVLKLQLSLS